MKRIYLILLLMTSLSAVRSQSPASFNYQAIAKNAAGLPLSNQQVAVRFTIHAGSANGAVEYRESWSVMTSPSGLFVIAIGGPGATNVQGSLTNINWPANQKFLQV